MAESISIQERIQRRIVELLEAMLGTYHPSGTVYRWDVRARDELRHLDHVVKLRDVTVSEGEEGNVGSVVKAALVSVQTVLIQPENDAERSDVLICRWRARTEAALKVNPFLAEAGGTRLARRQIELVSEDEAERVEGALQCASNFRVTFEHDWDDPYVGPGIELLEE